MIKKDIIFLLPILASCSALKNTSNALDEINFAESKPAVDCANYPIQGSCSLNRTKFCNFFKLDPEKLTTSDIILYYPEFLTFCKKYNLPKTLDFKKQLFKELIISAGKQASIKDVCDLASANPYKVDEILIQLVLEHSKNLDLNQPVEGLYKCPPNFSTLCLHEAVKNNNLLTAKLLLEHKANPNKVDYEGKTALDYATGRHADSKIDIAMVELLLQYKADLNVSNEEQYRNSHLHKVIINNDTQSSDKAVIVNLFIDNQADINAKNKDCNAPLHLAIEKRDLKVVEALIKRKADINLQNNNGHTPLHLATKMEDSHIIGILLKNGADINKKDFSGNSAFHLAVKNRPDDVVEKLLDIIPNTNVNKVVNNKNDDGDTPLHLAASKGEFNTVKILVQSGADIHACNKKDNTPLLEALASKNSVEHQKIVKYLHEKASICTTQTSVQIHEKQEECIICLGKDKIFYKIHQGKEGEHGICGDCLEKLYQDQPELISPVRRTDVSDDLVLAARVDHFIRTKCG